MKKRIIAIVILVLLILIGIIGFDIFRSQMIKKFVATYHAPPPYVSTVVATSQMWQPRLFSVGTLMAVNGVTVTTESAGLVTQIGFKSGDTVEKGQYLIQLDDSLDVQTLKNSQAQLTLTQLDYGRKQKLYRTAAISQSEYDQSLAALRQAQASVTSALVSISHKHITAPFAGKLGIRQANIGQYLNPGDAIVSLESLDPLFVNFSLPQRDIAKVHLGQKISLHIDAFPGENFLGTITAINSLVTEQTRNLDIQATIPNSDKKLYPGIFADVFVYLPEQQQVITLPQTAVDYSLYGNIVYVAKPSGKDESNNPIFTIEQRIVQTGLLLNNLVEIVSGVQVGETVVSSGQLKLANGMQIRVNNQIDTQKTPAKLLEGGR